MVKKYKIELRGKEIEIEQLDDGKFLIPKEVNELTTITSGCVNFDDCRIPYKNEDTPKGGYGGMEIGIGKPSEHQKYNSSQEANKTGRFPANLLVSDDVLNDGEITKSIKGKQREVKNIGSFGGGTTGEHNEYSDSGSFSRYFSLDSWWKERFNKLPENIQKTFPFIITPKPSKSEKTKGLDGFNTEKTVFIEKTRNMGRNPICQVCGKSKRDRGGGICNCENPIWKEQQNIATSNNHPTVKSIKLMSYLIILGSREGDIVLDPFIGSGTTGISAKLNRRNYIGFELDKEYCKIAEARLKYWSMPKEERERHDKKLKIIEKTKDDKQKRLED